MWPLLALAAVSLVATDVEGTTLSLAIETQTLFLALDLADKDLWVYGEMCYRISTSCQKGTLQYFRPDNTSTYTDAAGVFEINDTLLHWARETVDLTVGKDDVTIGGASLGTVEFGLVDQVNYKFYEATNASGELGLGLGSRTNLTGYVDRLMPNGLSFTLYTNDEEQTATLTLAGADSTNCGAFVYTPLSSSKITATSEWEIPVTGYGYTRSAVSTHQPLSGQTAVFTTTNPNIQIPPGPYQVVFAELQKTFYDYAFEHNLVDCRVREKLPDVHLTIGAQNYTVTPDQYIRRTPSNYCILRLVPNNQTAQWVLGYPFHMGHCQHFDATNLRIGLASTQ